MWVGPEGEGRRRLCLPPHVGKFNLANSDFLLTGAWGRKPNDPPRTRGEEKIQVMVGYSEGFRSAEICLGFQDCQRHATQSFRICGDPSPHPPEKYAKGVASRFIYKVPMCTSTLHLRDQRIPTVP